MMIILYRSIESLCCIPGADTVLKVNYTSVKKKKKEKNQRFNILECISSFNLKKVIHLIFIYY